MIFMDQKDRAKGRRDSETVRVGVIGHTGRLGEPLVDLLRHHRNVEIVYTESRTEGASGSLKDAEMVFLALPAWQSHQYLPGLKGKRIVDLSVDHRADPAWVYGIPELNRDAIRDAELVANPGCYATSIILGLAPIIGVVDQVRVASTSGISGAGLKKRETDNFLIYGESENHPHVAEIKMVLGIGDLVFIPQRIDTADRGIVSTIFANSLGLADLSERYSVAYDGEPFVRIVDQIRTENVNRTNFCDIKAIGHDKVVVVITALDNIMKGGSGQAVQNFNIMYGLDEKTGLASDLRRK